MRPVYGVIMAGGSGTRFWPASRQARPKQLLAIDPSTEKTLIEKTVERLAPFCPPERILVATGEALLEATQGALPDLPPSAFLGEPEAKNTAACIGWATLEVQKREPNALVMVVPSDHAIADHDRYMSCVKAALASADRGVVTIVGIRPTRGDTGYGYVETGRELGEHLYEVAEFKEKPDQVTADRYATSGKHLWNSGMFFFPSEIILSAIETHLPALGRGLQKIRAATPNDVARVTRAVFAELPSVSIDHGVIEKISPLSVVVGDFEWSDLGTWHAAWELAQKDQNGNAAKGEVCFVESQGNLVFDLRSRPGGSITALLGAQNLCVVQTDDAVLVMQRDRAQDVRKVVEELKRQGKAKNL